MVRTLVARYREEAEAAFAQFALREPADQLRAYTDYWATCISDGTRTFCVCVLLASEIPVLPPEVALEVKAYFRAFSAWIVSVMERGAEEGTLTLTGTARSQAEAFIATVHGAMLSARVYGDPAVFTSVTQPLIERLTAVRQ